ncbi:MAG: hypothetical protein ABI760_16775 [Ferruginibacter sp.]
MKRTILFFIVAGIIMSCNNEPKTSETAETKEKKESSPADTVTTMMPYTANYSSQFTVADQKIAEKVLTLFKQWDDNKLTDGKSSFADSVDFYGDNWEFHGKGDSFLVVSQNQRNNYKEVKTVISAWLPVHSTDKNEDWALVWSTAYTTDKKGKIDSANYQDTWRLNRDGKFDLMFDYRQRSPEPIKKK